MHINIQEKFGISGRHKFTLRDAVTGEIKRVSEYDNLIVTVCKEMIADRLAGSGNGCNITYGAVGTNATAPAAGNTTLGTEIARTTLSNISKSGTVVTARTFFGASEANATLTEFGLFGEAASAAADSGTMINHTVISETKTSGETLTIDSRITIS